MIPRGNILEHALAVAEREGLHNLTRELVAKAAGVSSGTVSNCYGGMSGLIDAVVVAAFKRKRLALICQAVVMGRELARERVRTWPNSRKLEMLQSVL